MKNFIITHWLPITLLIGYLLFIYWLTRKVSEPWNDGDELPNVHDTNFD